MRACPRRDVAEARLVAREQRQPRAVAGEALRDRTADPRAGPGDDDVLQVAESTAAAAARSAVRSASAVATIVAIANVFSTSTTASTDRVL